MMRLARHTGRRWSTSIGSRCTALGTSIACRATSFSSTTTVPAARSRVSPLNGRGTNDAAPVKRPHSWLLSQSETDELNSSRFSVRISPWLGGGSMPHEFSSADTRPSPWLESHEQLQKEKTDRLHGLIPIAQQRTQWILPYGDERVQQADTSTYAQVHQKPPRKAKSSVRRFLEIFFSVSVTVGCAAFYWSHLETVPITNRRHFIALSPALERQLGAFFCTFYLKDQKILTDPRDERVKLVTRVGGRIAAAANRPDWEWRFFVVDSPVVNAVCFPGGSICVYTGLLDLLVEREAAYHARLEKMGLKPEVKMVDSDPDSSAGVFAALGRVFKWPTSTPTELPAAAWPWPEHEALPPVSPSVWQQLVATAVLPAPSSPAVASELLKRPHAHDLDSRGLRVDRGLISNQLAVVLGHEVAHAIARHTAERLSWMLPLMIVDRFNAASPAVSWVYNLFYTLPYSRLHETEADELGLTLMSRACFHPGVGASFWEGFNGTANEAHYFSTHPADRLRSANAQRWYPQAQQEMKRCCR